MLGLVMPPDVSKSFKVPPESVCGCDYVGRRGRVPGVIAVRAIRHQSHESSAISCGVPCRLAGRAHRPGPGVERWQADREFDFPMAKTDVPPTASSRETS